jgi:ribosomal protein S18 acetylase RimI-like enzyme
VPEKEDIRLVLLDDAEYEDFSERQVIEHAHQRVHAGEWSEEEAPDRARQMLTGLLADKLRKVNHVFLKGVLADGTCVGWLWVAPAPAFLGDDCEGKRWLSQVTIDKGLRGQGYGLRLLTALHRWLEAQGIEELWLRVYNWNAAALRLYDRAGYEIVRRFPTDAHLRKRLCSAPADRSDGF